MTDQHDGLAPCCSARSMPAAMRASTRVAWALPRLRDPPVRPPPGPVRRCRLRPGSGRAGAVPLPPVTGGAASRCCLGVGVRRRGVPLDRHHGVIGIGQAQADGLPAEGGQLLAHGRHHIGPVADSPSPGTSTTVPAALARAAGTSRARKDSSPACRVFCCSAGSCRISACCCSGCAPTPGATAAGAAGVSGAGVGASSASTGRQGRAGGGRAQQRATTSTESSTGGRLTLASLPPFAPSGQRERPSRRRISVTMPPLNLRRGYPMQPFAIAPSILSADFARLGERSRQVPRRRCRHGPFRRDGQPLCAQSHHRPHGQQGAAQQRGDRAHRRAPDVKPVDRIIGDFIEARPTDITFHPEASEHIDRSLQLIKDRRLPGRPGVQSGHLAGCPEVRHGQDRHGAADERQPRLRRQKFIPGTLDKLREARALIDASGRPIRPEIDGGSTSRTSARSPVPGPIPSSPLGQLRASPTMPR